MNASTPTSAAPLTVSRAKEILTSHSAALASARAERDRLKSELVAKLENTDLKQLLEKNPKRAAEVSAEIALAQSQLAIAELSIESHAGKNTDALYCVLGDSERLLVVIRRNSEANASLVASRVSAALRQLGYYEEARLPRLVQESIPVRQEAEFASRFANLDVGGGVAFAAPDGGSYYPEAQPAHVVTAHNRIENAAREMVAHSKQLRS